MGVALLLELNYFNEELPVPNHPLLPQSPVCYVRADVSIGDGIRTLRDRALGALVVLSDDAKEEIVGIFTERDLVKNFELVQRGSFWRMPVRTVMTTNVKCVRVDQLHQAPKLMAEHHIRHLPVITEEKGKKRVVGVISMRDIFRITMEQIDYDLGKLLHRSPERPEAKQKLVGVFSSDPAIQKVVDESSRLTRHCVVKSAVFREGLDNLADYFSKFDVLFVDIDWLSNVQLAKLLSQLRELKKKDRLFLAFNPLLLHSETLAKLHKLGEARQVGLLSKPIALGLLYEKFLKEI